MIFNPHAPQSEEPLKPYFQAAFRVQSPWSIKNPVKP